MRKTASKIRFKLNEFPYRRMNLEELRALSYQPRFRAAQAKLPEDICSGATLTPSYDADVILDLQREPLQPGHVFLYLMRRFGFPLENWDEYKLSGIYILTTPRPDTFLTVAILSNLVHFSYQTTTATEKLIRPLLFAGFDEWETNLRNWAKDKHRIELLGHADLNDSTASRDYANRLFQTYLLDKFGKEYFDGLSEAAAEKVGEVEQNVFLEQKEAEYEQYAALYGKIRKHPRRTFPHKDFGNGLLGDVRLALCRTLKDLLRPTGIRDVRLNIKGFLKDEEDCGRIARTHPSAGFGLRSLIASSKTRRDYFGK